MNENSLLKDKIKALPRVFREQYEYECRENEDFLKYAYETGDFTELQVSERQLKFEGVISKEIENLSNMSYELSDADETRIYNEIYKLGDELAVQISQGKITRQEKSKQMNDLYEKLCKEAISKQKGAVPKKSNIKSKKPSIPQRQVQPLSSDEKLIHKQLSKNKHNCMLCRKLITGILAEKTKSSSKAAAIDHLNANHGITIPVAEKPIAPPTSEEMTWDDFSPQGTSYYRTTVTSQDDLAMNFPPLPPASSGIQPEPEKQNTKETATTSTFSCDEEGFIRPKTAAKRKASPLPEAIRTQNKFLLLTDDSENIESTENFTESEENANTRRKATPPTKKTTSRKCGNPSQTEKRKTKKLNLPPPFIIKGLHGKSNHDALKQKLTSTLTEGFTFKYTKNNTIIQVTTMEKYEQLKTLLLHGTEEWHTYATEGEKTHAFVAKGLDNEPDSKDIIDEIREVHQIEVKQIYPMRTKYRMLYLVITPASILLKHIKKIKYLNCTEVQWELRRKFTSVIQCKSCYQWGHSRIYCNRTKRCSKCGETHDAEECNNPIKCANCGGEHQATDTNCPVYKYRSDKIQERQNKQQPKKYIEAQKPVENIWEQRRIRMQARRQNQHFDHSTDEDESEDEAAAFSKRRPQTRIRQQEDIASTRDTNVSELLSLAKEFKLLGNKLVEAIRFLNDFLQIFKNNSKEERAFSLLGIMVNLDKYNF